MWLNGEKAGEFAIDTAIAGEHGVPVIMTSGCDKLCAEAKAFYPQVVTCQVKRSTSIQGAILLSPSLAEKRIYEKTVEAVTKLKEGKFTPCRIAKPAVVRKEFVERMNPEYGLVAPRTVEATDESVERAFYNAK